METIHDHQLKAAVPRACVEVHKIPHEGLLFAEALPYNDALSLYHNQSLSPPFSFPSWLSKLASPVLSWAVLCFGLMSWLRDTQGKERHLGSFMDPVLAAIRYDAEATKVHGAGAILNFPSGSQPSLTSSGAVCKSPLVPAGGCGQEQPTSTGPLTDGKGQATPGPVGETSSAKERRAVVKRTVRVSRQVSAKSLHVRSSLTLDRRLFLNPSPPKLL